MKDVMAIALAAGLILGASGCATVPTASAPSHRPEKKLPVREPARREAPRAVASLELTDEARILLEEGRTGDAIRLLERAVNLHPGSGRSYYYLAEAWIARGDFQQAAEFNGLAADYLADEGEWTGPVRRQKERIEKKHHP